MTRYATTSHARIRPAATSSSHRRRPRRLGGGGLAASPGPGAGTGPWTSGPLPSGTGGSDSLPMGSPYLSREPETAVIAQRLLGPPVGPSLAEQGESLLQR